MPAASFRMLWPIQAEMARNMKGADLELPNLACTVNSLIYVTSDLEPIGVCECPKKETFIFEVV